MNAEVDIHTLPAMLTALRLPSFQRYWSDLAKRTDAEGLAGRPLSRRAGRAGIGRSRQSPDPAPPRPGQVACRQDARDLRLCRAAYRAKGKGHRARAGDWIEASRQRQPQRQPNRTTERQPNLNDDNHPRVSTTGQLGCR